MNTATIIVRDAIYATHTDPVLSWNWQGGLRCTTAMLIEERVRTKFDRVHSGVHPSAFLSELARNPARISERNVQPPRGDPGEMSVHGWPASSV